MALSHPDRQWADEREADRTQAWAIQTYLLAVARTLQEAFRVRRVLDDAAREAGKPDADANYQAGAPCSHPTVNSTPSQEEGRAPLADHRKRTHNHTLNSFPNLHLHRKSGAGPKPFPL
eukprot:8008233-Heterocapsa_arctica.AAC.1